MTFISIPGMRHSNSDSPSDHQQPDVFGDQPGYVEKPVKDPATGRVLYTRKVLEEGFTPGMDEGDGINYRGDRLEKVADVFDRKAARTDSIYRRFGDDGAFKGEVKVEHEQINEKGDNVIARTGRVIG